MTEETTQVESNDEHANDAHSDRPSYDDVNTPVILMIGVISALVTYMTIAFVEGLCYQWTNAQIQRTNYDVQNVRQAELIKSQQDQLTHGPADSYVPYEQAAANVVERFASNQASNDGGNEEAHGEDSHGDEGSGDEGSGDEGSGEDHGEEDHGDGETAEGH